MKLYCRGKTNSTVVWDYGCSTIQQYLIHLGCVNGENCRSATDHVDKPLSNKVVFSTPQHGCEWNSQLSSDRH